MKKQIPAALLASLTLLTGCADGASYALTTASYPEMAPYPDEQSFIAADGTWDDEGFDAVYTAWQEDKAARRDQPDGYTDGVDAFARSAARVLLTDTEENALLSPLNLFLALGMMAEVTAGDTRAQILDVLGADSIETLRGRADSLWNANYSADGALTSVLASSFWLDEDLIYKQPALDTLSQTYHASAFQGQMGDPAFDKALQNWLNEQTGGLLEEAAGGITMDPENILTLAATVFYQAKWASEFREENNTERIFHGTAGDTGCTFMTQTDIYGVYHWSEHFGAVSRRMEEGGKMWLILPDEGVSTDTVLAEDAMYELISGGEWADKKTLRIHQYIPKFDVSSDTSLREGLAEMGITDALDPEAADYSPLTDMDGVALSEAKHAVRVAVDEEGVTAAAFTAMMYAGAAMPPEDEMDFVLDRPFIFVITGTDHVPLFMGVVNQP